MDVKQKALSLVERYFGVDTARVYKEYYQDKNESAIVESVTGLLREFLGFEKGSEIIKQVFNL